MTMSPAHRRAEQVWVGIMQMIHNHRARFFSEPAAEGFYIFLSLPDARCLDEASRRRGDFGPVSTIADGDTGMFSGLPFSVDATLAAGTAFVGYRIVARDVQPHTPNRKGLNL